MAAHERTAGVGPFEDDGLALEIRQAERLPAVFIRVKAGAVWPMTGSAEAMAGMVRPAAIRA
jgi:hypothetical protein